MNKTEARNILARTGAGTYEIAHSIYLATVRGVSGANQNGGLGFNLSAMAELWNIRGTIKNPYGARAKITGRYRGMGVTEDMILNVVSRYPHGIPGASPHFDELVFQNQAHFEPIERDDSNRVDDKMYSIIIVLFVILLVILRFALGWGWKISGIVALLASIAIVGYLVKNKYL